MEVTDIHEFHCFRVTFKTPAEEIIEIMLHGRDLVDLIHKCSVALCGWQADTTRYLLDRLQAGAVAASLIDPHKKA